MDERTKTLEQARESLREIVLRANDQNEPLLLTDAGEPVARILPARRPKSTAGSLTKWLRNRTRLGSEEAESFERDWSEGRKTLRQPSDPWAQSSVRRFFEVEAYF